MFAIPSPFPGGFNNLQPEVVVGGKRLYTSFMADDRYKMTNRKNKMSQRLARWQKEFEKEAEAENAKGKFLCADCEKFLSLIHFEYEYCGETKIARRCQSCRDYRRSHRGHRL
jgi:hypothetical protein